MVEPSAPSGSSRGSSSTSDQGAGDETGPWLQALLAAPVPTFVWRRASDEEPVELVGVSDAAESLTRGAAPHFVGRGLTELYGSQSEVEALIDEAFDSGGSIERQLAYEARGTRERLWIRMRAHRVDARTVVLHATPLTPVASREETASGDVEPRPGQTRDRAARALLEQGRAICLVWTVGPEGTLVLLDYNVRAVEVTEGRCASWLGQSLDALYTDQPEVRRLLATAAQEGRAEHAEARVRFVPGGLERGFDLAAFRIDNEVFMFATERERDRERVEALERLLHHQRGRLQESAALLEAANSISPVGYARINATGEVVEATDRWCELHDCDASEFSLPWTTLVWPQDRAAVSSLMRDPSRRRAEYRPRRGDTRHLLVELVPDPGAARPGEGWLLVALDITPQRIAEQRMRAAEMEVHRARKLEAIHQLSAGVAHDFNNLLSAINGLVELLLQSPETPGSQRATLLDVLGVTHRGAVLVEGLMAVGRRESNEPRPVDLGGALQRSLTVLRQLAPGGIRFVVASTSAPVVVWADPTQLEQVILNLGLNAAQAIGEAGTVRFEAFEEVEASRNSKRPMSILRVIDDGPGIDPSIADRLFEPFVTTRSSDGGTGLGLATVLGIVERHQGSIDVGPAPGGGTCFTVRLPRGRGPRVESPPSRPVRADQGGEGMATPPDRRPDRGPETGPGTLADPAVPRGPRILLVEDDEIIRSALARALQRKGYDVETAEDGEEGLTKARARTDLELLITDVAMPRMSGVELATSLRSQRPEVPILFLSGHARPEDQQDILRQPGMRWLAKPVRTSDVVQAIEALRRA